MAIKMRARKFPVKGNKAHSTFKFSDERKIDLEQAKEKFPVIISKT
jgi:hypothetical protein